jgi:8-oxo-dGTP pyrophosphatase MutT (NUDIX family)
MRKAINLIVIEDKKILLVKKGNVWILPGGKPDKKDTSNEDTLRREVYEELSGTEINIGKYYSSFIGITPYKKDKLEAITYFGSILYDLKKPSAEISDAKFIGNFEDYQLSKITQKIVNSLRKDNYL